VLAVALRCGWKGETTIFWSQNNNQRKGRGKTSTTILKARHQKRRSWQVYSLQQSQMKRCQPTKRLKD